MLISLDNLKTLLNITVATHDTLLGMLMLQSEGMINNFLNVTDQTFHLVTSETQIKDLKGESILELSDSPVKEIVSIFIESNGVSSEYTQTDPYQIVDSSVQLDNCIYALGRDTKVTYLAGYFEAGWATLTVSDYSAITVGTTINIDGTVLTAGTEFAIGGDNATTAANISAALPSASVRSVVNSAVIYIIDATPGKIDRAISITGAGLTLSSTVLNGAVDLPAVFGLAMSSVTKPMFQDSTADSSAAGPVKRFTIGAKTVDYDTSARSSASASGKTSGQIAMESLLTPYKRIIIC